MHTDSHQLFATSSAYKPRVEVRVVSIVKWVGVCSCDTCGQLNAAAAAAAADGTMAQLPARLEMMIVERGRLIESF